VFGITACACEGPNAARAHTRQRGPAAARRPPHTSREGASRRGPRHAWHTSPPHPRTRPIKLVTPRPLAASPPRPVQPWYLSAMQGTAALRQCVLCSSVPAATRGPHAAFAPRCATASMDPSARPPQREANKARGGGLRRILCPRVPRARAAQRCSAVPACRRCHLTSRAPPLRLAVRLPAQLEIRLPQALEELLRLGQPLHLQLVGAPVGVGLRDAEPRAHVRLQVLRGRRHAMRQP